MNEAIGKSLRFAEQNQDRYITELCELLRIPSISTRAEHAVDVACAARWIAEKMRHSGLERVELIQSEGQCPLVYGEWLGAGSHAPTILIYCHYDVQPAAIADGWVSDPFTPEIRDGKLYARGAVDSKSHVMIQLCAVEAALANGSLPINIKLLFEGEEESSGNRCPELDSLCFSSSQSEWQKWVMSRLYGPKSFKSHFFCRPCDRSRLLQTWRNKGGIKKQFSLLICVCQPTGEKSPVPSKGS